MRKNIFRFFILLMVGLFSTLFVACSAKPEVCKRADLVDLSVESMSFIPGGRFWMGSKESDFKDNPMKGFYISSFFMDKSEVTNAMYIEYLAAKPCNKKPKYLEDPVYGLPEFPVVDVTYQDAKDYCAFYQKRLPTEAEWEYAARGGLKMKKFPWGNSESPIYMNYRDSETNWAVAVKSYPPNKYDLYDMAGNVREWVVDTYDKDFYNCYRPRTPYESKVESIFGTKGDCRQNPVNKSSGQYKVTRGGSWSYTDGYPNSVYFRSFDKSSYHGNDLGFRCASSSKKDGVIVENIKKLQESVVKEIGIEPPEGIPTDIPKIELNNDFASAFAK